MVCVLTVHHTGRSGGDARGSSAIDGAQTTELKVNPKGKLALIWRGPIDERFLRESVDPIVEGS